MAFALLVADKQWGGSYKATATSVIGDVWSHDIDTSSLLPTGGSNYGNTSSKPTDPSYFAPSYYRIFATVDSAHAWAPWRATSTPRSTKWRRARVWSRPGAATTARGGSNGGSDDGIYQYDSHRVPWRLGLDACWNGTTTEART